MVEYLNETTFEEMLTQCGRHSNYEGVIALSDRAKISSFTDEIMRLHSLNRIPFLRDVRQRYNHSLVRFTNRSSIEITTADTLRNGERYHAILIDEDIRDHAFVDYMKAYEKNYEPDIFRDAIYEWQEDFLRKQRDFYNTHAVGDWWVYTPPKPVDPMENVTDTNELDSFLKEFVVNS